MNLKLLAPSGEEYKPLPKQAAFHQSAAKFRAYVGGFGCVAAETLIDGVPIAERLLPGPVSTLAGRKEASAGFLKGAAPLYRVRTQSGAEVVVTADHRFLAPGGWVRLRGLSVGDVIAADGSWRGCSDFFWDEITDITYVRDGDFYDLTVPFWEHYSAHGLWHHNSGKTLAGVAEAILLSLEYPGNVGMIGRRSYKELQTTTQAEFLRMCPNELIESFNQQRGELTLKNGSRVLFWNLQDATTFKSLNLGWFYLDEASEIDEEVFLTLMGRLRLSHTSNGQEVRRCGYITSNPNGHDWIWKWWVSMAKDDEHRKRFDLIHAPTKENKYLPKDYIETLEALYPPEWLSRFMEGSFDVFEGQVYPMLDDRFHMIPHGAVQAAREYIRPFVRARAIDHGFTNPTVCLWAAIDPLGNIFLYREYRKTRALVSENAANIQAQSQGEEYLRTLIDPSTRNRTGSQAGFSVLDEYREAGIFAEPANNDIRAGILRVSDYLRLRDGHTNPITGAKPAPMLYFFPDCQPTFEEMRMLQWKKLKPGQMKAHPEEPVDKDDHGPDALRYLIMDRPLPSEVLLGKTDYQELLRFIRAAEDAGNEHAYPRIGGGETRREVALPNGLVIAS